MKYLSLFSFLAALFLFASCHSSDVALRHSRIRIHPTEEIIAITTQKVRIEDSATTTPPLLLAPDNYTVAQSEKKAVDSAPIKKVSPVIQKPKEATKRHTTAHATTQFHSQPNNGVFGHIGHSFGVVGLVFIIVGLVLLLIGGLIIDTLGVLAIASGFVFILIWLVLAILQGLFDVIL